MTVTGTFTVKLAPLHPYAESIDGISLGRMSIDKTFEGPLQGTSVGEMLSARTAEAGSAGYVAIERVHGTLEGRTGHFALQHFATMDQGVPRSIVEVVPDSGTGELAGLTGQMIIRIEDGQHFYDFTYAL